MGKIRFILTSAFNIDNFKQWDNAYLGVLIHEMGHAVGLADYKKQNVEGSSYVFNGANDTIMGYDRVKNVMLYPTNSDKTGVDEIWALVH